MVFAISLAASLAASGDEIRHTRFSGALLGTWASSQELCSAKDSSSITISETAFRSSEGGCNVQWIVERAAAHGTTYGVHARCVDPSQPDKASTVDFILWPQGSDRISIGRTFNELKIYQRCPGG
jgi:hypothetical protein